MRPFFTLLISTILSSTSFSQSVCQTVSEGQTLTITAPVGMVFISVSFASYGTPDGSCGSFTLGGCHASNSQSIVAAALIGQNSASIAATNGLFGDPCGGTVKRLYVEAIYSAVTPLNLMSFSGKAAQNNNILEWQTVNEVNTKNFIIERSTDGVEFEAIGIVKTNNRLQTNNYTFSDNLFNNESSFYRIKMMDIDGSFEYSKIITVKNKLIDGIQILSNPVTSKLTLNRLSNGWIELANMQGTILQRVQVKSATVVLELDSYPAGIYIVKHTSARSNIIRKIIKQ